MSSHQPATCEFIALSAVSGNGVSVFRPIRSEETANTERSSICASNIHLHLSRCRRQVSGHALLSPHLLGLSLAFLLMNMNTFNLIPYLAYPHVFDFELYK